jgi:hypothetical protein
MQRAEAALQEQEVNTQMRLQEQERALETQSSKIRKETAELKQELEQLDGNRAALKMQQKYVTELTQRYGPLDLIGNKEEELHRLEALIDERSAEVWFSFESSRWDLFMMCWVGSLENALNSCMAWRSGKSRRSLLRGRCSIYFLGTVSRSYVPNVEWVIALSPITKKRVHGLVLRHGLVDQIGFSPVAGGMSTFLFVVHQIQKTGPTNEEYWTYHLSGIKCQGPPVLKARARPANVWCVSHAMS